MTASKVALLSVALALVPSSALALGPAEKSAFRTVIDNVTPSVAGVHFEVRGAGFMRLVDRHAQAVTIYGYEHEPYARILRSGAVQLNRRSPATYLDQNRLADVILPHTVNALARPRWKTVNRSGTLTWRDHRTHWMAAGIPPQVKDPADRAKVFNYRIPVRIDGHPGAIRGTLYWAGRPDGSALPLTAAAAATLLGAAALALLWQRRRRRGGVQTGSESIREAW